MSEIILEATKRDTGKRAAKDLRVLELVPGVFYENGQPAISIAAKRRAMRPVVYTSETKIIDLKIEGDPTIRKCVLKDFAIHPVTDLLTHFDLQGISTDHTVSVEVPIHYEGQPAGLKEGGVFQIIHHKIEVTCLPQDLPSHITANVANLHIGDSILIKDLLIPNVKFNEGDLIAVATVVAQRLEEESAVEATEAATKAEPEIIGQRGKKEEE